jgi:hypothetical protein
MPRVDLEQRVHEELRRLPAPMAPRTLLPRVMAAVQAWTERPWYARAWFTWPIGLQVLSLAAVAGMLAGAVVVAPGAVQVVRDAMTARASGTAVAVASAARQVEGGVIAARALWRALGAPLVPYVFVVVMLMGVACVTFGTALNRVAFGRS